MFEPTEEQLRIAKEMKEFIVKHTEMVNARTLPYTPTEWFGSFSEDERSGAFAWDVDELVFHSPEETKKIIERLDKRDKEVNN